MINNKTFSDRLSKASQLASGGVMSRFFANPGRYLSTQFHNKISYPKSKQPKEVNAKTFFGKEMMLPLPSGTDIYLTGAKSHPSELKLMRFLLNEASSFDLFVDIGAHVGFFSLYVHSLPEFNGSIRSFEASSVSYKYLQCNLSGLPNVSLANKAVGNDNFDKAFYEFPTLFSEYNSMNIDQYTSESWFAENKPKKITISGTTLDEILKGESFRKAIVKIDVEGAEELVVGGGATSLSDKQVIVVMEFLREKKKNRPHKNAFRKLQSLGYTACVLNKKGNPMPIQDPEVTLSEHALDSDNFIFYKK